MPRVSYVIIALTNRQCGGGMRYNADDPGTLVVPERERNPRGTETKGVASISSFRYFYYLLPSSTMCNMSVDIDHSLRNNRNHRNTMSPLSLSLSLFSAQKPAPFCCTTMSRNVNTIYTLKLSWMVLLCRDRVVHNFRLELGQLYLLYVLCIVPFATWRCAALISIHTIRI